VSTVSLIGALDIALLLLFFFNAAAFQKQYFWFQVEKCGRGTNSGGPI